MSAKVNAKLKSTPVSSATLRYLKSSAQKTRLVVNQIRGRKLETARAILMASPKGVAPAILKLLQSAAQNAENRPDGGAGEDLDELFVSRATVDEGPAAKRIQPAPMGRAFGILKRQCHVTIELGTPAATTSGAASTSGKA